MKFRSFARKALPYVVAVAVFWVVSALYFAPQLSGDTLAMGDVTQYGGMKADIVKHRAATGEDPQWTGGIFGGMPAYSITVQYPAMILRNAVQGAMNLLGEPMALMFLAMLGFWIMLLMFGVDPWLAIPFAVAYGLSTYNVLIIEAGHITKMRAMGYAPMLVGAVWWTLRRNVWVGGALAALFGALQIAAAHPQITYYFLLVVAAMWIGEFVSTIREKGWGADVIKPGQGVVRRAPGQYKYSPLGSVKLFSLRKGWDRFWLSTVVLIIAAVFAAGANFTHLWYTFEHASDTTRGGSEVATADAGTGGLDLDYATAWSYGVGESLNMFIPNFRGGTSSGGLSPDGPVADFLIKSGYPRRDAADLAASLPGYWGTQPGTGGPTYLGAVMVFLFALGMFVLPGRAKWWVLGVSLFALLLAWGRNAMWFTEWAFAALPGYNKFRTVAMALAVLQWSVPFVGALVAAGLWRGEFTDRRRFTRGLLWALGLTGGVALFFALFGGWIYDFSAATDSYYDSLPGLAEAVRGERAALLAADCWRSLVFVALTAGLVWLWYSWREKMTSGRKWWVVCSLTALVLIDLVTVDLRFLSRDDFHAPRLVEVTPDQANLDIMADPEPGFRVMNTENPFNEAYTSYFHRSVGGYHAAKLGRYQDVIDRYLSRFHPGVLGMLNTKYFIVNDPASGERTVELNGEALGAAWFVDKVAWVDGAAEELEALDKTDLRRVAVADGRFRDTAGANAESVETGGSIIKITEYRPNYLKYTSSSAQEQVAVFSEIYYDKGWTAFIDGREAPYFRADYILRAMVVPAGDHTIEWRFRAPRFAQVEAVTLASSILILLWLAAAVALLTFNSKKNVSRS